MLTLLYLYGIIKEKIFLIVTNCNNTKFVEGFKMFYTKEEMQAIKFKRFFICCGCFLSVAVVTFILISMLLVF